MASEAKVYSKTARRKAAKILQGAHDLIEREGFDISDWGIRRDDGTFHGPFCYIGAVRAAAKLSPYPVEQDASAGDGPELILAFEVLDELARSRFPRLREWLDDERPESFEAPIGRYIETMGFAFQRKTYEKYQGDVVERDRFEKADALKMLRKALTRLVETGDLT